MDLLKILLIFTILTVPTGEILRVNPIRDLGINLIDISLTLTAAYGLLYLVKSKLLNLKYEKYLFVFLSVGILSLLFNTRSYSSDQISISLLYPIRFLFLVLLIPIIRIQNENFKKLIKNLLLLDGLMIIGIGLIQFFFYPGLRNLYYLGWDEHLFRLFSTFLDPNFTGVFLVLFIIFLIWQSYPFFRKRSKETLFYTVTIILSAVSLVLTYSRQALISFSVVSLLFVAINKKKMYIWVLLSLLLLIVAFQLTTVRSEGTNLFRTASIMSRIGSSSSAVNIIREHPLFGVGFNSYRYVLESKSSQKQKNNYPSHTSAPDNSFLFVLATTGIVGFIFYTTFWYKLISKRFKVLKLPENQIILGCVLALFIGSFFVNALFYTPIMVWFFTLLGVTENS